MKARITRHAYTDEIKTEHGEFEIDSDNNIIITIDELNIKMIGKATKKMNVDFILKQDGPDSYIRFNVHWRDPWTMIGEWKSKNGGWEKITISIKDLKKERIKDWWDKDDFADKVETALIAYNTDHLKNMKFCGSRSTLKTKESKTGLNRILETGPTFSPFYFKPRDKGLLNRVQNNKKIGVPFNDIVFNPKISIPTFMSSAQFCNEKDYLDIVVLNPIDNSSNLGTIKTTIFDLYMIHQKHTSDSINIFGKKKLSKKFHPYSLYIVGITDNCDSFLSRFMFDINFNKRLITPRIAKAFHNDLLHQTIIREQYLDMASQNTHLIMNLLDWYYQYSNTMWQIIAAEDNSKVTFKVNEEQVHSLLYAQSTYKDRNRTPLTQSGKFAPIKHFVKSHQRRMRNGTTITIPRHLRGVDEIRIGTTDFKIIPNPD